MSGRKSKKASSTSRGRWFESPWLSGILLVAVGLYLGLSISGGGAPWWTALTGGGDRLTLMDPGNPGGPVGSLLTVTLSAVFGGLWVWVLPALVLAAGIGLLVRRPEFLKPLLLRLLPLWLASAAWIAQPEGMFSGSAGARFGGLAGYYLSRGFHALFGLWGARIFLTVILLVVVGVLMRSRLGWVPAFLASLWDRWLEAMGAVAAVVLWPFRALGSVLSTVIRAPGRAARSMAEKRPARRDAEIQAVEEAQALRQVHLEPVPANAQREPKPVPKPQVDAAPAEVLAGAAGSAETDDYFAAEPARDARVVQPPLKRPRGKVRLPGVELLTPAGPDMQPPSRLELDAAADLLESTLHSFGVEGEVKDVRPGPVVTTFEYQPGSGIRVNQIVQRADDLALAMRARSIRMEAPIPGKAAVGIEIPNAKPRMVRLREVLEKTDQSAAPPLSVVLGKNVVGRPVSVDLASLPHLLVAGSTGSGKSVCLNSLICNLLLRNDPSRLRMLLIDPKMLEMNVYNGIPHLLLPVVTDPRESLKALQWLVAQMEYRYRNLAKWSVRNIIQYNTKVEAGEITDKDGEPVTEVMPYYLAIVDELADLMLQMGGEMEGPITRLAQKARAVGIHLILATQRPSVDVLTGVIKANIPCRIAFRVIQKNDSRTILDMNGAEQLLGHGDMLYLQPGRALPVRVHGSFIDVDECEAIAAHWRNYDNLTEEISLQENPAGGGMVTGQDDLFEDAKKIVVLHQSGSTSLLQRRLRIGYTRAGRLMDMLEEAGVVGPFTGSKARDVLIKPEDLDIEEEGRA
ncbi:cell division protein FtsK [bacterium CG_4_9_14_3_um_filter_65_15]|nr:MAG: cell division protein FtsK [bacterium CG_4_9_14_3_um_filter_65_15]